MSAGAECTAFRQLGFQLLMLVDEIPVLRKKFLEQPSPNSEATLKIGNTCIIWKDSCRVIFTRPSNNNSTRISGTGDDVHLLL